MDAQDLVDRPGCDGGAGETSGFPRLQRRGSAVMTNAETQDATRGARFAEIETAMAMNDTKEH